MDPINIINDTGQVGAVPPPPGVVPDLANPRDAGRELNIAAAVAGDVLITMFFFARSYAKWAVSPFIRTEDWTCLISWCLILSYSATVLVMHRYGEGYHAWELSPADYEQMMKWLYITSLIYNPAAYFTKVTLLLVVARVFSVKEKVARGIYIFIVTLTVVYLPVQVIKTAICIPVAAFWDPKIKGEVCFPQRKVFIVDISLSILTDVVILILPIMLAYPLRMSVRKKLKIIFMLGAGGGAVAVGAYRGYEVVKFLDSQDVSADFVLLDVLTIMELSIGLVCACIPPINLLFEKRRGSSTPRAEHSPRSRNNIGEKARAVMEDITGLSFSRSRSKGSKGSKGSKKTTTADTTVGTTREDNTTPQRRPPDPGGGDDFDVELAMLTGYAVGVGKVEWSIQGQGRGAVGGTCSGQRIYSNSITSAHGRAEGWLREDSAEVPSSSSANEHTILDGGGGIWRTVEISMEMSSATGGRGSSNSGRRSAPPPATAAMTSHAAYNYNGGQKIIPGMVWDGRTNDAKCEAVGYPEASRS